jgi:transcriptional regulator with XRE-family HTH domain
MKNDLILSIGTAVKNLRLQQHMSQADLSKLSGVGRSYITRLGTGTGNPSYKHLSRIAKALNSQITITLVQNKV